MSKSFDLLCTGVALVDSIIKGFDPNPVSASGFVAESCSLNAGGEAVNEAVAAAKLGLKTGILCALGADGAGAIVEKELRDAGADLSAVVRTQATPVTTMFVNPDGTRKSITNTAHRANFHPEQYPNVLRSARAVTLGSLFRAPYNDPQIVAQVVKTVKDSGALVFADTKLPNFVRLGLDDLRESLPLIDWIFPNEDEARYYSGKEEPEEMADVFLRYGVGNVVVKLGAQGCLMKNVAGTLRLPACRIHAVDATGAGDNFLAGFAAMILEGKSPEEALRFANACGAACTTAVGASAGLKDRAQVLRLMNVE